MPLSTQDPTHEYEGYEKFVVETERTIVGATRDTNFPVGMRVQILSVSDNQLTFLSHLDNQYTTYEEIVEALLGGEVTGALIDAYVLGSRKDLFENPSLRVIKVFDYSSAYGLVLSGEAKKLRTCFGKFAQSHKKEIFETIESHVESVEVRSLHYSHMICG